MKQLQYYLTLYVSDIQLLLTYLKTSLVSTYFFFHPNGHKT